MRSSIKGVGIELSIIPAMFLGVKNADNAMYHAKEHGRTNAEFYSNTFNAAAHERLILEGELRYAIVREEFVVYYQPQIDLQTGGIIGAEALVRWQHPQRGLLPPAEFLPAAIDTGLIRAIDEWVLRTACRHNQTWQRSEEHTSELQSRFGI